MKKHSMYIYGRALTGKRTICTYMYGRVAKAKLRAWTNGKKRNVYVHLWPCYNGKKHNLHSNGVIKDKYHTVKTLSKSNRKIIERDGKIKNMVKLWLYIVDIVIELWLLKSEFWPREQEHVTSQVFIPSLLPLDKSWL